MSSKRASNAKFISIGDGQSRRLFAISVVKVLLNVSPVSTWSIFMLQFSPRSARNVLMNFAFEMLNNTEKTCRITTHILITIVPADSVHLSVFHAASLALCPSPSQALAVLLFDFLSPVSLATSVLAAFFFRLHHAHDNLHLIKTETPKQPYEATIFGDGIWKLIWSNLKCVYAVKCVLRFPMSIGPLKYLFSDRKRFTSLLITSFSGDEGAFGWLRSRQRRCAQCETFAKERKPIFNRNIRISKTLLSARRGKTTKIKWKENSLHDHVGVCCWQSALALDSRALVFVQCNFATWIIFRWRIIFFSSL